MPYITSFLPSKKKRFWRNDGGNPCPDEIHLKPHITQEEIEEAMDELETISDYVHWCLNSTIQPRWKHLAETRLVESDEPWEKLDVDTVLDSDLRLKFQGQEHRSLTIGIMNEFFTVLRDTDPRSEQHLRATFMAAVTMVHEVGHIVFHTDFRSLSGNPHKEPYVEDSCEAELGHSFVNWIFSGFHPLNIPTDLEFKDTLFWVPQDTLSMGKRPLYTTHYSIPLSYIERLVVEEFWQGFGDETPSWMEKARRALRPNVDGQSDEVATSMVPNWRYSHLLRRPMWKGDYHYRLPGFMERDRIKGLSVKEIEQEREKTEEDREHASRSKEERHQLYRLKRSEQGLDVPSDDDSEFWDESPSESSKPTRETAPSPEEQVPVYNVSKSSGGPTPSGPKSTSPSRPQKRARSDEPDLGSVIAKTREIAVRVANIESLVYEPGPPPRKRRMLGSKIAEEIDDYLDVTEGEPGAAQGGKVQQRGNNRLKIPRSHMQDIYEQIIAEDDST